MQGEGVIQVFITSHNITISCTYRDLESHHNIIQLSLYFGWVRNKPDSSQNYTVYILTAETCTSIFELKTWMMQCTYIIRME